MSPWNQQQVTRRDGNETPNCSNVRRSANDALRWQIAERTWGHEFGFVVASNRCQAGTHARCQREIAVPFQEIFSVSKVWPVADSPKVCRTRISACGTLADNNSLPGMLRKPARRINSAG